MATTHTIFPEGAEKTLERQARAFHWVRQLCAGPGRLPGSGECQAAAEVERWFAELGFEEIDTLPGQAVPRPGLVLALHLALAAAGCAVGGVLGFALAGLSCASFQRGQRRGASPLARLLPAGQSANLVARAGARKPRRRVVLSAGLGVGRAGVLFSGRFREGLQHSLGVDARPERWNSTWPARGLLAAVVVSGASALGAEGTAILFARTLLGGTLALGVLAACQWAWAPASPGANVNASGVAALLTAAEQLAAQLPPDVELWCAALGGDGRDERALQALLDAHPEWSGDSTAFVSFLAVGGGKLHYARSEGVAERRVHRPMLEELARRIAASGAFGEVTPVDLLGETGAAAVIRRNAHALALVSLDDTGAPRHLDQRDDVPEHLDMEAVIRAADFGCSVVSAHWRGDAEPLAYV